MGRLQVFLLLFLIISINGYDLYEEDDAEELTAWDLKMILQERGIDYKGITERKALLKKVRESGDSPAPTAKTPKDMAEKGATAPSSASPASPASHSKSPSGSVMIRFCMS